MAKALLIIDYTNDFVADKGSLTTNGWQASADVGSRNYAVSRSILKPA